MNIIHLRERVDRMVAAQALSATAAREFATAPVFDYATPSPLDDEALEFCEQHLVRPDKVTPRALPYPCFIFSLPNRDSFYVWGHPFDYRDEPDGPLKRARLCIHYAYYDEDGTETWVLCRYTGERAGGVSVNLFKNGRSVSPRQTPENMDKLTTIANLPRKMLVNLLFDLTSSANVLLETKPHKPGKSVQWVQARTHYCLLTRPQAERCRKRASGPTDHEIVRAAHWRRAHFRRLRAASWGKNQGKLVPVKQAWIGPEEWVGTDKKIYKVILSTPQPA